jgi:hypothetical protein
MVMRYIQEPCSRLIHLRIQEFRRVLSTPKIQSISALSKFHQLLVLQDGALLSYNLRMLVRVIQRELSNESFAGSVDRLSPKDHGVYLFSVGVTGDRNIGM